MRSRRDGNGVQGSGAYVRTTFCGGIDHAENVIWSGFFCDFLLNDFSYGRSGSVCV